jgi:ubiquinone/menaquinone biosynthesis C-methylase UbiE
MSEVQRPYLPAAGRDWALPFYDPIVGLLGLQATRRVLIDQAAPRPGQRILEIGCGTGSLVVLLKRLHPDVSVTGLDPDPKALARAARKAARAEVAIALDRGFSDQLPYDARSFDRVLSSFMFHHLPREVKEGTLREVARVLKPAGALHLLDFAGHPSRSDGFLARMLHSSPNLRDNAEDRVVTLMREAGLADAAIVKRAGVLLNRVHLNYYRAGVEQAA